MLLQNKVTINLVDYNDKFKYVNNVVPNVIFNRLDLRFGTGDFEILEISYLDKKYFIEVYNKKGFCYIGLYMAEIPQIVCDEVIRFLDSYYKDIYIYHFPCSFVKHKKCSDRDINYVIELPEKYEDYENKFSSKHRYNIRYRRKRLEEQYNCKFEYYSSDMIDDNFKKMYCKLKSKTTGGSAIEAILNFDGFNEAYVLKVDDKIIAAAVFVICDKENVYCSTFAYDNDFYKYSPGLMIFYYSLEQYIKRHYKKLYMGTGHEYKKGLHAKEEVIFMNDRIFDLSFMQKMFLFKKYVFLDLEYTAVRFLGLKFQIKKKLKTKYL
ncbi:GNAT family N-acetyltransferase [bacterium]|nr:GNAT family N-acetyltransferase [bacterium]